MDYNKYCYEIAEVVLILMEKRSIRKQIFQQRKVKKNYIR